MKAGIVVDDWKLAVFRKRLTAAGFTYTDAGDIVKACQRECSQQRNKS